MEDNFHKSDGIQLWASIEGSNEIFEIEHEVIDRSGCLIVEMLEKDRKLIGTRINEAKVQ